MPAEKIRIILVDDHQLVRDSLELMLGAVDQFTIVKTCANGYDAIEQVRLLQPDILLLDINMSPLNGFEVAQKVLEENPAQKLIGLSVNNLPSYANRMMSIGAKGYITKSSAFDEIVHAIMEVYQGKEYIASEIKNMTL